MRAYSSSEVMWKGSESRDISPRLTGDGSDVAAPVLWLGELAWGRAEPCGLNKMIKRRNSKEVFALSVI